MTVIKVPKTPKSAFNKNRPASSLLQAQIEHLEAAAGLNQPPRKAARRRSKRRTEGEAAAYIGELTRQLHPQLAKPFAPPDAVVQPSGESDVVRAPAATGVRKNARPAKKRRTTKMRRTRKMRARRSRR